MQWQALPAVVPTPSGHLQDSMEWPAVTDLEVLGRSVGSRYTGPGRERKRNFHLTLLLCSSVFTLSRCNRPRCLDGRCRAGVQVSREADASFLRCVADMATCNVLLLDCSMSLFRHSFKYLYRYKAFLPTPSEPRAASSQKKAPLFACCR